MLCRLIQWHGEFLSVVLETYEFICICPCSFSTDPAQRLLDWAGDDFQQAEYGGQSCRPFRMRFIAHFTALNVVWLRRFPTLWVLACLAFVTPAHLRAQLNYVDPFAFTTVAGRTAFGAVGRLWHGCPLL